MSSSPSRFSCRSVLASAGSILRNLNFGRRFLSAPQLAKVGHLLRRCRFFERSPTLVACGCLAQLRAARRGRGKQVRRCCTALQLPSASAPPDPGPWRATMQTSGTAAPPANAVQHKCGASWSESGPPHLCDACDDLNERETLESQALRDPKSQPDH
eukprot:scaffold7052_cov254-Pinguiococcus_pyrenoidosus.AAC.111